VTIRSASLQIDTPAEVAVVNITRQVGDALARAGVGHGLAVLTVPHTTCGLCVNEDEAGLKDDLIRLASRLPDAIRPKEGFHHDRIDDNARAHLGAVLFGHSVTVPVVDGELVLGSWQSLFLMEMDGPRSRRVDMIFMGDRLAAPHA